MMLGGSTCLLTILLTLQVCSRQEGARRPLSPLQWQLFVKVLIPIAITCSVIVWYSMTTPGCRDGKGI